MRLTDDQIETFDREGWLFFPEAFTGSEMTLLAEEAQKVFRSDRQEVWREKSGVARTAFAAQTYNEAFRRLAAHPRLVTPIEQLLRGRLYMHQFKLNAKAAFDGEVWPWHQDFGTWHRDDGMPEPRAMNIALFIDEVTPANGPLFIIPRSHRDGVLGAGYDPEDTYPIWTLDRDTVRRLADAGGIEAPCGKPGSVLMFHSNIVHASPPNISPRDRTIAYLTLCETSNHITRFNRPEWIAQRDFTPIEALPDDCLAELAAQYGRQAAE